MTTMELEGPAAPQAVEASTMHRVEIVRTGARYDVFFGGKMLVAAARDPEHAACRALLARGITGTLETHFSGGTVARMRMDIVLGAGRCTGDDEAGLRFRPYKPFDRTDLE